MMAIQQAANARNWGDVLGSTAMGAGAGASLFGLPGAVAGGVLAGGMSILNMGNERGKAEEARASVYASNMTDAEIINKYRKFFSGAFPNAPQYGNAAPGSEANLDWRTAADAEGGSNEGKSGLLNRFQIRRSALIVDFMTAAEERDPAGFQAYMQYMAEKEGGADPNGDQMDWENAVLDQVNEWNRIQDKFIGFADSNTIPSEAYIDAGEDLIDITQRFRNRSEARNVPPEAYQYLNSLFGEYFDGLVHPMELRPVYTQYAKDIIERYAFDPQQLATSNNPQQPDANVTGDPTSESNTSSTSSAYSSLNYPMAPEPNDRSWGGLDSRMKRRLRMLFQASKGSVTLGPGGGTRSTERQRQMFLERYRPDPNGKIEWNGQRWRHVSGAAAAPPGRSMHEIGMAADLAGPGVNNGWLKANVAKFGLKEFSNVNNEPWHVQLKEFPNSRREYEGVGDSGEDVFAGQQDEPHGAGGGEGAGLGGGGAISGIGFSSGSMLMAGFSSLSALAGTSAPSGGGKPDDFQGTGGASTADTVSDYTGSGPMTGEQIAKMAYKHGFRGEGLVLAVAISKRESNWNPAAFNGNSNTGDKSYGLFQINMIGDLGPARRAEYGLSSNEELFNPDTNMEAAFKLSSNGSDFHHWGGYKGMADNYNTDMSGARQIVQSLNLGDAAFAATDVVPSSARSSSPVAIRTGFGTTSPLNVNVTIQSTGNYAYDAQQLAKAVRPAFEREYAEVTAKRST